MQESSRSNMVPLPYIPLKDKAVDTTTKLEWFVCSSLKAQVHAQGTTGAKGGSPLSNILWG